MEPATRSTIRGKEEGGRGMPSPYGVRRPWVLAVAVFLLLLLPIPMAGAAAPHAGVSWDYRLMGPLNQARDDETDQTIVLTGSGSFDTSTSTITGGGGYTILDPNGDVVGSGKWTATTFDSFAPMGPGGSPSEGGRLELEASFDGIGSAHVVINCSMWGDTVGPPGFPWPPDFVEVGPYTTHVTGAVMFNLNQ